MPNANKSCRSRDTDATAYAGIDEGKIVRVVGLASLVQLNKEYPRDPTNRRISIVVLNRKAEQALRQDGNTLDVTEAADLQGLMAKGEPAAAAAPSATSAAATAADKNNFLNQGPTFRIL